MCSSSVLILKVLNEQNWHCLVSPFLFLLKFSKGLLCLTSFRSLSSHEAFSSSNSSLEYVFDSVFIFFAYFPVFVYFFLCPVSFFLTFLFSVSFFLTFICFGIKSSSSESVLYLGFLFFTGGGEKLLKSIFSTITSHIFTSQWSIGSYFE